MSDILERLRRKTRRHVLASMPEEAKHLEQESLVDLLIEYRTWRGQFIAPVPRRVHLAEELRTSDLPEGQEKVLKRIVAKIEAGEDLTPHLSSAVQRVSRASRSGVARRDHLLSEWGMHHLHLSEKRMGDGFLERTNDALFVIFRPEDAYLIGIYGHPKEEN